MLAETIVALYTLLLEHGMQIWIDGGMNLANYPRLPLARLPGLRRWVRPRF